MRGLNISILLSSGTGQQCTSDNRSGLFIKGLFAQLDLGLGLGVLTGAGIINMQLQSPKFNATTISTLLRLVESEQLDVLKIGHIVSQLPCDFSLPFTKTSNAYETFQTVSQHNSLMVANFPLACAKAFDLCHFEALVSWT